jgi:hypothetical protein
MGDSVGNAEEPCGGTRATDPNTWFANLAKNGDEGFHKARMAKIPMQAIGEYYLFSSPSERGSVSGTTPQLHHRNKTEGKSPYKIARCCTQIKTFSPPHGGFSVARKGGGDDHSITPLLLSHTVRVSNQLASSRLTLTSV